MPVRARWRGLELPVQVTVDHETLSGEYGEFFIEPFERGFGHTVANSLRRVLLSSLEGAAIVAVKIEGVQQEFSALDGVKEDVTEVVLNVKQVVLELHPDGERVLKLNAKGPGKVTAGDIERDPDVEIANPDHVIATLTDKVDFSCELTVRKGRGYVPADEHADLPATIGLIPIDSLFSPVQRVAYAVRETRVGRRTNYDRLALQIWTNGTVSPQMALVEAAKILRKHLNPFVQYSEIGRLVPQEEPRPLASVPELGKPQVTESMLSMPLKGLDLSVRALHCLEGDGMKTVGQLLERSEEELLAIRSLGDVTMEELREKLAEHSLEIGLLAVDD